MGRYNELVELARQRRLPTDATGGSIATVTNFGTFGLTWATPIPLPEQTLVLGLGAGRKVPDWDEKKESIRARDRSQPDPEFRSSRAGRRRGRPAALARGVACCKRRRSFEAAHDFRRALFHVGRGLYGFGTRRKPSGRDCAQIFVKNNMQWFGRPPTPEEVERFAAEWKRLRLASVFGHTGYLINLGAPPSANRDKSLQSLIQEITFAEALGLPFLVLHPGAHLGAGEEAGLSLIVAGTGRSFWRNQDFDGAHRP